MSFTSISSHWIGSYDLPHELWNRHQSRHTQSICGASMVLNIVEKKKGG